MHAQHDANKVDDDTNNESPQRLKDQEGFSAHHRIQDKVGVRARFRSSSNLAVSCGSAREHTD